MEIRDRVVVVTGGGGGIGSALCRRFAADGARQVVVSDIDHEAAAAVAAEIGGTAVPADVTVESDVASLVGGIEATHGRIDIYCSNAGIAIGGGPEASDAAWRQTFTRSVWTIKPFRRFCGTATSELLRTFTSRA